MISLWALMKILDPGQGCISINNLSAICDKTASNELPNHRTKSVNETDNLLDYIWLNSVQQTILLLLQTNQEPA